LGVVAASGSRDAFVIGYNTRFAGPFVGFA
jgi:hypothetical protein